MSIERVVVAGNETEELRVICEALAAENLEVDQLHTVDELMERAGRDPADVVFLDLPSLQAEPDSLLHGLRMVAPQMRSVLIIDRTQVKAIVGAVRAAGGWYLVPPALPGEITALVACLRTQSRLEEENRYLRSEQEREYDVSRIVNIAPLMQEVLREAARAARSEEPVFLVGEPGTGKQLLAYTIHRTSPRGARCFVKVDLATSPPSQIERELFGYERGAVPGALSRRAGAVELAAGGTLFLREVVAAPFAVQARLLRLIEEGEFERLGGRRRLRGQARIIASSSTDPYREIARGRFREDLLFRMNNMTIQVPPLRERREEIPAFVDLFLRRLCARADRRPRQVDERTLALLQDYRWPGNLDELAATLAAAALRTKGGVLLPTHLRWGRRLRARPAASRLSRVAPVKT